MLRNNSGGLNSLGNPCSEIEQVKAHVVLTFTNTVSPNHLLVIDVASDRPQTMNHIVDTCPLTKI